MDNKILSPPSGAGINFLDESSRKRKLIAADECGTVSDIDLGHGFSKKANLLHKTNPLSDRRNPHGLLLDSKSEAVSSGNQPVKDQYHSRNSTLPTLQSNKRSPYGTEAQKINNFSTSMLSKSFHYVGSLPLNKMPDGKTLPVTNGHSQTYNLFSQEETLILPRILEFSGKQEGQTRVGLSMQDIMSLGYKNHVADNRSMEVQNSSTESLRPSNFLHQSFHDERFVDLEGKTCILETRNYKSSSASKQNDPKFDTAESSVSTVSSGFCAQVEHAENDRSLQNKTPVHIDTLDCVSDNLRDDDQSHRVGSIQTTKETNRSRSNSSLVEKMSPNTSGNSTDVVLRNYLRSNNSHSSSKLSDEKSILLAGKLALPIAGKFWDGSLRLNSSVSVSAVAIFKSGEKMLDIKWPETIEVKGKVRLDDFERYIKDLSRSRNRGLMVISLCWKEGSSKSGLVGMKKVAKGYKEGKRVGFVKLSPGIDLYVCPHSDSTITILAKHGFFKGMAAVVDNQDSLIGCVVWRRNIASANTAAKKSDAKNCSLSGNSVNSSSSSSRNIFISKELCCEKSTEDPIPVASETKSTTLESAGKNGNEGKHQKTSEVQLELHNSSASAYLSLTPSVLNPETFLPSKGGKESASLQGSMAQPEVETLLVQHKSSIEERPEPVLEVQKPGLSLPSEFAKQPIPTLDDDDLPEFDFRTECGISHPMSKPLDSVTVDKKLPAEGLRTMDGLLQPAMSMVTSLSAFKQPRLEIFNLPRLPPDAIQRMSSLKKVSVNEEKQNTQRRGIMQLVTATASKNLFNDDDDDNMPEWYPPNAELRKQSVPPNAELHKPPVPPPLTLVHSEVPNSRFQSSASYPSCLAVDCPPFTQPFPQAFDRGNHCSINISMKLMQPRSAERFVPRGSNSSIAFNAKPPLRPPSNVFSVFHPVRPTGWRGWRP